MPITTPMEDIVNGVLVELRLSSGQDVQIHLQNGIVANINRLYRYLMRRFAFRDFVAVRSLVTSAVTGSATIDPLVLDSFQGLLKVFLDNSVDPLPVAPALSNLSQFRRPVIVPTGNANIFAVYPLGSARNITVWSKIWQTTDYDISDDIPFYKDILVVGVAQKLSVKMGVNDALSQELQKEYSEQLMQHVMDELQDSYQTNIARSAYPDEWYVDE